MTLPRDKFRERLGTYLLGVAIGCVLVGMAFFLWSARQRQTQQLQPAPATAPAP